jgi:hypothetical protein
MTTQPTSRVPAHLAERYAVLRRRGFERHADGWHGNGLEFQTAGSWLQFKTDWPANADPLSDHLAKPGLWKPVRAGRQLRRVFNVQESVVGASEHAALLDETERKPFESLLDWAADTAAGVAPVDWALPGRDAIDACLPKARLTIVHRSYTRQVELIHAAGRLALRGTLLSKLPVELPEFRLRWLRALLLEAQDDNHLVRLGLARDRGQTAVVTEIDLTGVPAALFEPMLSTSLDALRWVALLVESADFIAETGTVSRALEICPVTQPNPLGDPRK